MIYYGEARTKRGPTKRYKGGYRKKITNMKDSDGKGNYK